MYIVCYYSFIFSSISSSSSYCRCDCPFYYEGPVVVLHIIYNTTCTCLIITDDIIIFHTTTCIHFLLTYQGTSSCFTLTPSGETGSFEYIYLRQTFICPLLIQLKYLPACKYTILFSATL